MRFSVTTVSLCRVKNPVSGARALSQIFLIGAFAAFSSWSFYGSGASIDLADKSLRTVTSLRFSALAGAFLVGVAGAKWITSEVDKRLLKETV